MRTIKRHFKSMKLEFPKATQRQTLHQPASSRLASGMLPPAPYLTWNVRKITWSLKPKPPQHFEILPAMGKGWRSGKWKEEENNCFPFSILYFLWKLSSPLYTHSKSRSYFLFLCPFSSGKRNKKALPSFTLANSWTLPWQVCWGAGALEQLSLGYRVLHRDDFHSKHLFLIPIWSSVNYSRA